MTVVRKTAAKSKKQSKAAEQSTAAKPADKTHRQRFNQQLDDVVLGKPPKR